MYMIIAQIIGTSYTVPDFAQEAEAEQCEVMAEKQRLNSVK